ncbi:MAG: TRAP transporter permease [Rhizobiales bacterium]|nr:TRAP transporter permease [Hyphomicrobiales bacterium]
MNTAGEKAPLAAGPDPAELMLDSEMGRPRALRGWQGWLAGAICAGVSLYALYWTQFSINTTIYRATFLGLILAASLILFPFSNADIRRARIHLLDWVLIAISTAAIVYLCTHLEATKTRATMPLGIEVWLGGALLLVVLEATRRTTGWVLPAIAAVFLFYGYFGPYMPAPFNHRGFSISRIVGQNYLTLEGLFSTPLDVAATFIIIFTLFGAVLDRGGAGKFFIDWAFALFGKRPAAAAPGRAVVASGFLLGTVSGSGVATTVTLASLAWPMLKRSGYPAAAAGGLTSAAGIGATLSPPTLGAAAFIIAEYLNIDYFDVLVMATIPTVLYYLSCWFMVEADARKLAIKPVRTSETPVWQLTITQGYHFISLFAIAVLLFTGMSAFLAVFWSIVIAIVLSLIRADQRLVSLEGATLGVIVAVLALLLGQRASVAAFYGIIAAGLLTLGLWWLNRDKDGTTERMIASLVEGGKGCVGIAATCATAGIIVSIINLSGLGLKLSGLIVDLGGGSLLITILLAAFAMWLLGTAVPVTASYIIAAVVLVPALTSLGVPAPAAHMFMFYYAVLADVSPPTALAPFAASAICGGKPFRTMLQAWKYTLPAFVVPVMFCLSPQGEGLLLLGDWWSILEVSVTSTIALIGFALAAAGWIITAATPIERLLAAAAGCALMVPHPIWQWAGAILLAAVFAKHWARLRFRTKPG